METDMELQPTLTVDDATRIYPQTVRVFNTFGIDARQAGAASIADAARRDGVEPERLMRALRRSVLPR